MSSAPLKSKEHHDLMEAFERQCRLLPGAVRLDREDKNYWSSGNIYQDGRTNSLFLAYRLGYAQGRAFETGL